MIKHNFKRARFVEARTSSTPEDIYNSLKSNLPLSGLMPALEYHNAGHAVETAFHAIRIAKRYNKINPSSKIDPYIAGLAGLLHDIHYGGELRGHTSFEERSAESAYILLKTLGLNEDQARRIESAIYETHAEVTPKTILGKILRAADLAPSASSEERFNRNFLALKAESERTRGPMTEENFFVGSMRFFAKYLAPMIHLTPEAFRDGASEFHSNALTFIIKKFRGLFPGEPVSCSIGTIKQGRGLNIAIVSDSVNELARMRQDRGLTLVIPLVGTKLPLPNGSCDTVSGEHPDSRRILVTA